MADTGWTIVGTGSNDSSYGTYAWTNTSHVTVDDDSGAYPSSALGTGSKSQYLVGNNLGFSLPTGATIDGIEVKYKRKSTDASYGASKTLRLRIVDESAAIGSTDKSDSADWDESGYEEITAGGASDLWGDTWSETDIEDSDFGFTLLAEGQGPFSGVYPRVDYMAVKVYYTAGGTTGTGALTLSNSTLSGQGVMQPEGSGVLTLPNSTLAASATQEFTGNAILSLLKAALSGTGSQVEPPEGSGALSFPSINIAASALQKLISSAVLTLANLTIDAVGTEGYAGTGAIIFPGLNIAALGVETFFGSAVLTLANTTLVGAGKEEFIGTASIALSNAMLAASGSYGDAISGTAVLSLAKATLASQGLMQPEATAALLLAATNLTASGALPDDTGLAIVRNLVRDLTSNLTRSNIR